MPQTKLLLVVDDTDISRLATCMLAEGFGYRVDNASSCAEALVKLDNKDYACIIMDYQMPEFTGKECTEHIRTKLQRHIPIIGYTSSQDSRVFAICVDAGMNTCLNRSGPKEELEDALKTLLFPGVSTSSR